MKDHKRLATQPDYHLFYNAFNASPVGIALENMGGQPLFANPALCHMLGFDEEEMRHKHCVEFSPPEDAEKDWALFTRLRAGLIDHYSLDKRFYRKDGSLFWGRLTVSLLNHSPSPLVVGMVEDITEKREAEEKLQQSETNLQRLAENLVRAHSKERKNAEREHRILETLELVTKQMAVAVYHCSRDMQYLWANQGYADLLHRPLQEIAGHPIADVLGPGAFDSLRRHFEKALSGEKVTCEEELSNYAGMVTKWISATYTPTFDVTGVTNGWVAVVADITARRRMENELRQSEARLAAESDALARLNRATSRLWRTRSLQEGLDEMLAAAIELMGADKGNIQLLDEQRGVLTIEAQRGFERHFLDFFREVSTNDPSAGGRKLLTCQRVVIEDVEADVAFAPLRSLAKTAGFRAVVSTPLFDQDGKLVGVLSTHFRSPHRPTQESLSRLDLYAQQAAGFIQRCKVERALSSLGGRLIEAQEQERLHISRELHDDTSQKLALLSVDLQRVAESLTGSAGNLRGRLDPILKNIAEITKDVHALSHRLHTSKLETLGLVATMRSFCREVSEQREVQIDFAHRDVPEDLSPQISLCLFRVLQEGLSNAVKHSGVRKFDVRLERESNRLQLAIRDHGAGFDPGMEMFTTGLGLISMRERVNLVNGTLAIESKPGGGTEIRVSVPIAISSKADQISVSA
jgi:PAS domain S-box-containing protein